VPEKPKVSESETLYQQALTMENGGDVKGAIRVYRRAARGGSGKAAKRLGEIFDKGVPGVSRDYAESLQWYETARQLGETVETAGSRGVPIIASKSPEIESAPSASAPRSVEPVLASTPASPAPKPIPPKSAVTVRELPTQKSEKVPPPAPVEAAPAFAKSAAPVEAPKSAPPPETESGTEPSHAWIIVIGVIALVAIILWTRLRHRPIPKASPPKVAALAPKPPADAAMLFVSYSHKDRPRVEPIVSVIEEMGRRVWMDRTDITGQTGWAGQIVRAIRESRAVVLMASPNSYASDQVVRELYLAMNHKKTIVPIEIEPAELPDELQYILAPFQHHRLSGGETRDVIGRALAAV
jgi:hypothetical protein